MYYYDPPITDKLLPPKVTSGWSLLKFLRADRSSRRACKRSRSHRVITARESEPLDPARPSLTQLSDELILLIINNVQDVSPKNVPVLALVSSFYYSKARYIQHREELFDLGKAEQEVVYLRYQATAGLLPAIRTLRFDYCLGWPQKGENERFPDLLNEQMNKMTGLRDVYWDGHKARFPTTPISLIQTLKQRPRVRLHTSVVQDRINSAWRNSARAHALQQIFNLAGCPNLCALRTEVEHTKGTATQETQPTMQRLQELPLSCPSLRRLSLDIHVPRGGCVMEELTAQYCGLGLSNGEKLPALQELEIVEYPWGHQSTRKTAGSDPGTIGYPEEGTEEDY